jgi:hypothetical protein
MICCVGVVYSGEYDVCDATLSVKSSCHHIDLVVVRSVLFFVVLY